MNLCDFLIVPLKDYKPQTNGWMYPKNSLLQELFDKYMLELYQTGVIQKIENSFPLSKMCLDEAGFTQMEFHYVRIFFVLFSIGLFLAIIIGLFEKIKASDGLSPSQARALNIESGPSQAWVLQKYFKPKLSPGRARALTL